MRQIKRIWAGTLWISQFSIIASMLGMYAQGFVIPVLLLAAILLCVYGILLALHLRPSAYRASVHVLFGFNLLASAVITILFGGLIGSGMNVLWGFLVTLGATIFLGRGTGSFFWLSAYIVSMIASSIIGTRITPLYTMPHPENILLVNMTAVVLFIYIVLDYFVRQRDTFQKKSDDLLRNILPESIAERLKQGSGLIAEHFADASVLFADIVDFTPMSTRLSPEELVALLNDVFSEFDRLIDMHRVEKIKTIGDCYMVSAGVPRPRADHAHALASLALEMQALVRKRTFGGQQLRLRIGINSGPLVAGVIGQRKFIYDMWGDVVNTASRMESHASIGTIQISRETYLRIRNNFNCILLGTIQVKGKGAMEVYELAGRL